jgi:hypothetical protein
MADEPTDAVLQILIRLQESIATLRSEVRSELAQFRLENKADHDRMESMIRKQRRDAAGMLVMMRATVGHFDERVSEVAERLTAIEAKVT